MDFSKIIEQNKEQMLKTLKELLQIRSVLDESLATKEQPFGPGIDEALKYMLDVAKQDGFKTVNDDPSLIVEIDSISAFYVRRVHASLLPMDRISAANHMAAS